MGPAPVEVLEAAFALVVAAGHIALAKQPVELHSADDAVAFENNTADDSSKRFDGGVGTHPWRRAHNIELDWDPRLEQASDVGRGSSRNLDFLLEPFDASQLHHFPRTQQDLTSVL